MTVQHYIGLDVHKKSVSYCAKLADGTIVDEGKVPARGQDLQKWAKNRPAPWHGAMEATIFSAWIYDVLQPFALKLEVGNPAMMKAIAASKKKNDQLDARKIADLVRCNLLPGCYMGPPEMRELRRMLRFRHKVVEHATMTKCQMSGMLMEVGAQYSKRRLHGKAYFGALLSDLQEVPGSVKDLLQYSRSTLEMLEATQKRILQRLQGSGLLAKRINLLQSIPGVGQVTSLTWALEIMDAQRFSSVSKVVSYCGLTAALVSSAGKDRRGPISKQRNRFLQHVLIEAAKLAPRWNKQLEEVHDKAIQRGADHNQATLEVARKLAAYLFAVDRTGQPFQYRGALKEPNLQEEGKAA